VSFEELSAFAARVTQVIWGLFVGYARSAREPHKSDDDATLLKTAEMVVAAIDSSFWLVRAPDPVAARFEQRFQQVSEVGSAIGLRG
jgi:hypothetical protein